MSYAPAVLLVCICRKDTPCIRWRPLRSGIYLGHMRYMPPVRLNCTCQVSTTHTTAAFFQLQTCRLGIPGSTTICLCWRACQPGSGCNLLAHSRLPVLHRNPHTRRCRFLPRSYRWRRKRTQRRSRRHTFQLGIRCTHLVFERAAGISLWGTLRMHWLPRPIETGRPSTACMKRHRLRCTGPRNSRSTPCLLCH